METYFGPSVDDTGSVEDSPSDISLDVSQGHQGDKIAGGNMENCKVLYCSNLDIALDYEDIYLLMKQHGRVEKIS